MELNQSEGIVKAKSPVTKPEKVVEMNSDDQRAIRAKTESRFTPKNGSTVIPAKRRLVKTMMFDSIVKSIASLLRSLCSSASGTPKAALSEKSSSSSKLVPLPPPNSSNSKLQE
ncbi:hypothetical protein SO802_023471 [Lithocarpus litseifolius]|uniref:Uncharacterized protein n=1 Tax=Lithocarpus litseifolius TaxID=425828 RepID=A0AAW2C8H3_9ROSI